MKKTEKNIEVTKYISVEKDNKTHHIVVKVASSYEEKYASPICDMIQEAVKKRGTGIAKREPDYIKKKIRENKAIIALLDEQVIGFCYIETWENNTLLVNSGLIVHQDFRQYGLAKQIKKTAFELSKKTFPQAKLFGITTSLAVMKINSDLGYTPVTFSELTRDENFWNGCKSCLNYDILMRMEKKMCLCTAMVADLSKKKTEIVLNKENRWEKFRKFIQERKIRWEKFLKKYKIQKK